MNTKIYTAKKLLTFAALFLILFFPLKTGGGEVETGETSSVEEETSPEYETLLAPDMRIEYGALEEEKWDENDEVAYINNLITDISLMDPEDVPRDYILLVRERYAALPMSGKARIENYALILQFIEDLRIETPEETEETLPKADSGKKLDTAYYFVTGKDPLSITVHYVIDSDGDGKADTPEISLLSPEKKKILLGSGTKTIDSDEIRLDISWEEGFAQLDIEEAEAGLWCVNTSELAVMSAIDYRGRRGDFTPEPSTDVPIEGPTDPSPSKEGTWETVKGLLPLIIFFIAIPFVIILLRKVMKRGEGTERPKKKRKDRDEFLEFEEEEEATREEEEAERLAMVKYLKSQQVSSEYDDEAADEEDIPIREELKKDAPEDGGLQETVEYPSETKLPDEEEEDDDFGTRI